MPFKYYFLFKIAFYLALVGSYTLAILPQEMASPVSLPYDKLNHIIAFIVLSIFLKLSYSLKYIYTFLLLLFYGIFIEISQSFTPNRSADVYDVFGDSIGIVIGLMMYKLFFKRYSLSYENS